MKEKKPSNNKEEEQSADTKHRKRRRIETEAHEINKAEEQVYVREKRKVKITETNNGAGEG